MQNGNVFRFEDKNLVDLFIFLKGIKTAEVLQSGVDIVLKDRSLIPRADLSDINILRTAFNAKRKSLKLHAFGSEYVHLKYSF